MPTFSAIVATDWYNEDMKKVMPQLYEKFNGCYKAIQIKESRTANYWLTQLENSFLEAKKRIDQLLADQEKVKDKIIQLLQYSCTAKSDALKKQEQELFTGNTSTQRSLRQIFTDLETSDLMNLRIQDFLELASQFQDMVSLYLQKLLEDSKLLGFFKKLEDNEIIPLLEKEEMILNINERPRILACFHDIPKYHIHIRKGLAHEVYVNTLNPEDYIGHILDM